MDEEEARSWLARTFDVPRETMERIEAFIRLLAEENERQNLVSRATLDQVWQRHIIDSAQLLLHAPERGRWADLGSGAGFPGIIIGLFREDPVTLVEQRRLRVEFLERSVELLGLKGRVAVVGANASQLVPSEYQVISARAFAPLPRLFALAAHLAAPATRWVLPKGRKAKSELEEARASWQGVFRLERSVTDPEAQIVIAEQVRRRAQGKRA
jgi:16S rRNA (guanine527-N7)-methyltransferase